MLQLPLLSSSLEHTCQSPSSLAFSKRLSLHLSRLSFQQWRVGSVQFTELLSKHRFSIRAKYLGFRTLGPFHGLPSMRLSC